MTLQELEVSELTFVGLRLALALRFAATGQSSCSAAVKTTCIATARDTKVYCYGAGQQGLRVIFRFLGFLQISSVKAFRLQVHFLALTTSQFRSPDETKADVLRIFYTGGCVCSLGIIFAPY